MAGYSARQSTFTSGDTITAAHSNDEFNQLLAAFHATTGHTHDSTAGDGGPVTTLRDSDALNKILVDTTNNHLEFYVEVSSTATQQLRIQDGAIVPITDNDIDLGTSSLEFKDLYVDGTAYVDAINFNGTAISATAAELNIMDGVTSTAAELNIIDGDTTATSTTVADADRVVLNDGGTMKQVAVTDLSAYFDDEITAMPNLTSVGTLTTLTVDNIIINGTNIGHTSDTDALAIDSSGNVTASQNLTVTGDLTVSGDDITMGTNTAGNLLIADGTNFNSVAAGSLSEISTVANDDVFIAVDTSGGGLKKIARSTIVAGLATSGAISNVVEDTSPQLGANLDTNSHNILIDDAHFIADENGNEQIIFQTTSSAVNQFDVTNAATGNPPSIKATGGDTNIDFNISAKGTGHVTVLGDTNSGAIQFNCENNSHGQILKAQPHSASVTNEMLLPDGANSTLVSLVATQTLTNKTLTSPKINEDVAVTSTATELNLLDGITAGTVSASLAVIVDSNKDITGFRNVTLTGELDAGSLDISGDADIDGTLEADAITINGTTLAETISDTVGAMVGSNTETGIAVTYDDADNTLDFVISALPLSSIDIDGGTDIGADLTTSDLIVVDDGAGGTNRKAALSRLTTFMTGQGFSTDDPTALAIALG
jgi:cytoskeletal protein CcmA (bactofilin family)